MRIAMSTDTYFPRITGVASAIKSLKMELERRGHEVLLIVPKFPENDPLLSLYREDEENVVRIPAKPSLVDKESFLMNPLRQKIVNKMLDQFKPEILHCHTEFMALRFLRKYAKKKNLPLVGSFRTNFWEYIKIYLPFMKVFPKNTLDKIVNFILRRLYRGFDCVMPLTESFKKLILENKIHNNVEVVHSSLQSELFYPDTEKRSNLKKSFFDENKDLIDKKILIYVARLSAEKNIPFLFEALKKLLINDKSYVLYIIGDGPDKKNLETLAKRMELQNHVIFTGYIVKPEIIKYLCASKLFVVASLTETQGNTVVEALSCGLPVIALQSMGIGDVLKNDMGGLRVKDLEEFVISIEKLINNDELYSIKSTEALSRAEDFRDTVVADRYEALYSKFLKVRNN